MNSSNADIFSADVASNMTTIEPVVGADSNRSAKFLEHAANISLWARKTLPVKLKINNY